MARRRRTCGSPCWNPSRAANGYRRRIYSFWVRRGSLFPTALERSAYPPVGGTVDSQRDFIDALSNNEIRRGLDRQGTKIAPVANHFALGYSYYDVLDADQEGKLSSALWEKHRTNRPRYPRTHLPLPPNEPIALLQLPHTTAPYTTIDTQYLDRHIGGLVTAMAVDAAASRMDPPPPDRLDLAEQRVQGNHGRSHAVVERSRKRGWNKLGREHLCGRYWPR